MKVSFDFDNTLDNEHIQEYVRNLPSNIEVHVVTNNYDNISKYIFKTTDKLNILRKNVHFLGYLNKSVYFSENFNYIFHLDDDYQDINKINCDTNVQAILFDDNWELNCNKVFMEESQIFLSNRLNI